MAIKLKATKTYTDGFSSQASSDYYGVIDEALINKHQKKCNIHLTIYKDSSTRASGCLPVDGFSYLVEGAKFDEYFHKDVLNQVNVNSTLKAYEYVLAEVKNSDDELIWGNWESDES